MKDYRGQKPNDNLMDMIDERMRKMRNVRLRATVSLSEQYDDGSTQH